MGPTCTRLILHHQSLPFYDDERDELLAPRIITLISSCFLSLSLLLQEGSAFGGVIPPYKADDVMTPSVSLSPPLPLSSIADLLNVKLTLRVSFVVSCALLLHLVMLHCSRRGRPVLHITLSSLRRISSSPLM
jgi:hypothetical protein